MDFINGLHPTRNLICGLCKQFYTLGWATGSGGGIAIKHPTKDQILVAPSGVQKERLRPSDLFVVNVAGDILKTPLNPALVLSQCWPLFQHAFVKRGSGAVIHAHSLNAVMVSKYSWYENSWRTELQTGNTDKLVIIGETSEMVKGLRGLGYHDVVEIPIIDNTAQESDLANSLGSAIDGFPDVDAVIVRNHGIYVWGDTWQQAKTQAECLDYLFVLIERLRGRERGER